MSYYDEVGTLLRDLRHDHRLSTLSVAKLMNISEATLSRYETAKQCIPLHMFCRLLAFYKQRLILEPKTRLRGPSLVIELIATASLESAQRFR